MTEPQPERLVLTITRWHGDEQPALVEDVHDFEFTESGMLRVDHSLTANGFIRDVYAPGSWAVVRADGMPAPKPAPQWPDKPGRGRRVNLTMDPPPYGR
jgi:hypothetical protein